MKPEQANPENAKGSQPLKSKLVDGRRLIEFASFVKVLGVESPTGCDTIPVSVTCEACSGTGIKAGKVGAEPKTCLRCSGAGHVHPLTITVSQAVKLSGLSPRTIVRKIAAGNTDTAA
jgi:DnaJ-class molecular chaperone